MKDNKIFKIGTSLLLSVSMFSQAMVPVLADEEVEDDTIVEEEEVVEETSEEIVEEEQIDEVAEEEMTEEVAEEIVEEEEPVAEETVVEEAKNAGYFTLDDVEYEYSGTNAIITNWNKEGQKIEIPNTVSNGGSTYKVTGIADYVFFGRNITEVKLGSNIKSLGEACFKDCSYLTKIQIPSGCTSLGSNCFSGCNTNMVIYTPLEKAPSTWTTASGYKNYIVAYTPDIKSVTNTTSGLNVQWDPIATATGYEIYLVDDAGNYQSLSTSAYTSYVDINATENVEYSYAVRALYKNNVKSYSSWTYTRARVTEPQLLKLENTTGGIKVRWNEVLGADTYDLYRKEEGGTWSYYDTITAWPSSATVATYIDSGVVSGKRYYYSVKAYDGSYETTRSSSGKYIRFLETPVITKFENRKEGLYFKINEVPGADTYLIYKVVDGKRELLVRTTDLEFIDINASTNGTNYSYQVRAKVGSATYSAYSDVETLMRLNAPKLKSVKNTVNGVTFQWYSVTGATAYNVYRKVTGGTWKLIKKDVTDTFYEDGTVSSGKKYYYTVKAKNLSTVSVYNETGKYITYLEQPVIISVTGNSTGATVKWDSVAGCETYIIYLQDPDTGKYEKIGTSTTTSFKYTAAKNPGLYLFVVKAKVLTATYSAYSGYVPYKRLKTPSITGSMYETTYRGIKWSSVTDATGYNVLRKEVSPNKTSWKKIAYDVTSLEYKDYTATDPSVTYAYAVQATDGTFISGYNSTGVTPSK